MSKKALLIGATGLVGKQVLQQLLENQEYDEVRVLTRSSTKVKHDKLVEHLVDFDKIADFSALIQGDVLFSTLGTTLKTAGSKKRQYEIDYDMQYNTAEIAQKNGVKTLVLLSSTGANPKSKNFYSRMKGELDAAVKELGFEHVQIIRPSMLTGDREEFRWSEKIGTPIMKAVCWIPGLRKYRPIEDQIVARAMVNADQLDSAYAIHELEGVFDLAEKV